MPMGSFEVFYDGQCPLCAKEISFLRWLDRRQRIVFTDITNAGFDAQTMTGRSFDALMGSIHGRMADGSLVQGVEVFRQLYARVGFGGLIWLTRLPGLRHSLDAAYTLFARYRLRLTGRCLPDGRCEMQPEPKN